MSMFYRADLFKKYNLPVPTAWAKYAADDAKLHAANPNEYITDFPPKEPGQFAGFAWQAGAHWFSINGQSWKVSINDAPTQQVASYWQNFLSKKLVKTETDFTNGWYNDLQTGALATWLTGPWGAGIIEQNAPKSSGDWRGVPLSPGQRRGTVRAALWRVPHRVVYEKERHP